jgi:putative transposase
MIEDIRLSTGHSVRGICACLGVPRSSHYHAAAPAPRELADAELGTRIEAIFHGHRRRYGYRRIWYELHERGVTCAAGRIRRLMRERGLHAIQPRTFVPRTSDGRADAPSPNLIEGQPLPARPNEVWAGDLTFIRTSTGWLYLAVIIDLCSRRIIGWALADHMRAELVVSALQKALDARQNRSAGLIFHSDRGSQYGSRAFRSLLGSNRMRQSMSARANPYHNAWSESVIGRLKAEMLQDGCFDTHADARTEIFAYIDGYYNTRRRHSSIGYTAPASFEATLTLSN